MLSDFPVLATDAVVKRALWSSAVLVALALVAAVALGQPLAGVGVLLGFAAAVANHRLFQVSTARYTTAEGRIQARPYAGTVATRLGTITIVTVLLVYFVRPMGFGMLGGLVAFQAVLMVTALRALVGYHRAALAPGGKLAPSAAVASSPPQPGSAAAPSGTQSSEEATSTASQGASDA